MEFQPPKGVASEDWRAMRRSTSNVLIIGPEPIVGAILDVFVPLLAAPVTMYRQGMSLPLDQRSGSRILHDVSQLGAAEQRQLLGALSQSNGCLRTISTSTFPLYQLVERGAFLDDLYYRLNVITINLESVRAAATSP